MLLRSTKLIIISGMQAHQCMYGRVCVCMSLCVCVCICLCVCGLVWVSVLGSTGAFECWAKAVTLFPSMSWIKSPIPVQDSLLLPIHSRKAERGILEGDERRLRALDQNPRLVRVL